MSVEDGPRMTRVLVLHGPNLSRLGRRQPDIYGRQTLADVDAQLRAFATQIGLVIECRQSNHEGVLVDALLSADDDGFAGVLLNAGAYAHTSLAVADAVVAIAPLPVIEVHLSNTAGREPERQRAVVGGVCRGRVEGFGADSYVVALLGLSRLLPRR
jgi:3-dehydroquinate dehydratase-2